MARSLGTLGFANNAFIGNTREIVSNSQYTTPWEFLTIFIPICGGHQERDKWYCEEDEQNVVGKGTLHAKPSKTREALLGQNGG